MYKRKKEFQKNIKEFQMTEHKTRWRNYTLPSPQHEADDI